MESHPSKRRPAVVYLGPSFIPVSMVAARTTTALERLLQLRRYRLVLGHKLVVDEVQRSGYNRRLSIREERAHDAGRESSTAATSTAPGTSSHQLGRGSGGNHNGADIITGGRWGDWGHHGRRGEHIRIEVLLASQKSTASLYLSFTHLTTTIIATGFCHLSNIYNLFNKTTLQFQQVLYFHLVLFAQHIDSLLL